MDFRTIFGVLGNLTAFITFLLPVRSLIKIRRGRIGRSPDLFSSASYQYHAAIINCTLWVLYGDDFQKAINTVGFYMEFFCLTLFILFTRGYTQWLKHSGIVILELICIYLLGVLALSFDDPIRVVGAVCATGSIFITVVVQKMVRETSRPPFFETIASVANGFVWTIYALVSSDIFILAANLAGSIVGIVKHVQYVKQQRQRKIAEEMRQRQIAEEVAKTEPDLSDYSKLDRVV